MGIILPQEVEVNLKRNAKLFEDKGYIIPRHFSKKKNKMVVIDGSKINVNVLDLPKNSAYKVYCTCDICNATKLTKMSILSDEYGYVCYDCRHKQEDKIKQREESTKDRLLKELSEYVSKNGIPVNTSNVFVNKNGLHSATTFHKHFGGDLVDWLELIDIQLSEKEILKIRNRGKKIDVTKEDLIKYVYILQNELNRPLLYEDFKNPSIDGYGLSTIIKHFGTVNKMKKELNLEVIQESMLDRQLSENDLKYQLNMLKDYVLENNIDFLTRKMIDKINVTNKTSSLDKSCKIYYNKSLKEVLKEYGIDSGNEGNGKVFDFDDGEHTVSSYEYMFSSYLRENGFIYNKDYFRDIRYDLIDKTNTYKGKKNCDYYISKNDGNYIYIELAGILNTSYDIEAYKNNTPCKSKSKEAYRLGLNEKSNIFVLNKLNYKILLPHEMTTETYKNILDSLI